MAREGHVTHLQETGSKKLVLVRKPRPRWKDTIEINLTEIGFEDVEKIYLAQNRGL
jgi:hypothetical protein